MEEALAHSRGHLWASLHAMQPPVQPVHVLPKLDQT